MQLERLLDRDGERVIEVIAKSMEAMKNEGSRACKMTSSMCMSSMRARKGVPV